MKIMTAKQGLTHFELLAARTEMPSCELGLTTAGGVFVLQKDLSWRGPGGV